MTDTANPGVNVRACGLRGDGGLYTCPTCNFTSDDREDFATVVCWTCAMGGDH